MNLPRASLSVLMGLVTLLLVSCSDPHPPADSESAALTFFVAPDGDDSNRGSAMLPFASLERARDQIREVRDSAKGVITVSVAAGDYYLRKPFTLSAEDSGTEALTIRYVGEREAGSARLIGGERISGWEPATNRIYKARIPDGLVFNTLYENGIRARKARFPNVEPNARLPMSSARYLLAEEGSDTELIWRDGDLAGIDPQTLDPNTNLVFWPWSYADWQKVTRRIGGTNPADRTIHVPENRGNVRIGRNARYYLEGDLQFLDEPGEFHLDRQNGILYYWPRFGDPNDQEIIAPLLRTVVAIEGQSADHPVRNLVIEGLGMGFTETFDSMTGPTLFPWSPSTDYGAYGTLHLRYTEDIQILFNHITNSGLNAIYLDRSNKRNRIYGNWIEDTGISGIVLAYHRQAREFPNDVNEGNLIENNMIHRLGAIGVDSAGINLWGVRDNTVRHCEIFDGVRYGVSIRGNFAQLPQGPNEQQDMPDTNRHVTGNNHVEYSHLYRLGQDSGDMGAVHMAGISSKTVFPVNYLENLLIEDIQADPSMQDIAPNAVFFDYPQGVTDQVLRNIDVRNTPQPYRTNRTNIRQTIENCSWQDGFDPSVIDYTQIGLRDDFPMHFGPLPEVSEILVSPGRNPEFLTVSWTLADPADADFVRVTAEGEPGVQSVLAPAEGGSIEVPNPRSARIVNYRIQTEDAAGGKSYGVLVRAGVNPGSVRDVEFRGISGGIQAGWAISPDAAGYRLSVNDPTISPIDVDSNATSAQIDGLEDHRVYLVRIDSLDKEGRPWPGPSARVVAGEGIAIPQDSLAWWTFDESEIDTGLSIGDASGNGNTLFVADDAMTLTEGVFGKAIRLDGNTAHARVLGPEALAIGTGDYAISVWIRQAHTTNLTERFLDFGGNEGRPGISIMANNTDVRVLFNDGTHAFAPFYRGLEMVDRWTHVVVNLVRNGELSIYVNGEKLTSEDISAGAEIDIPPAENFYVGRFISNDPRFFWPGDLDQLRIFNRSLNPAEIAALFQEAPMQTMGTDSDSR